MWIDNRPFENITTDKTLFSFTYQLGIGSGTGSKISFDKNFLKSAWQCDDCDYSFYSGGGVLSQASKATWIFKKDTYDLELFRSNSNMNLTVYFFYSYDKIKTIKMKDKNGVSTIFSVNKENKQITKTNNGTSWNFFSVWVDASDVTDVIHNYGDNYFCLQMNLLAIQSNYGNFDRIYEINIENYLPDFYSAKSSDYYANFSDWQKNKKTLNPYSREVNFWQDLSFSDMNGLHYGIASIPGYQIRGYNISGFVDPNSVDSTEEYFWNKSLKFSNSNILDTANHQNIQQNCIVPLYSNFHLTEDFKQPNLTISNNKIYLFNKQYPLEKEDILLLVYRPSRKMAYPSVKLKIQSTSANATGYGNAGYYKINFNNTLIWDGASNMIPADLMIYDISSETSLSNIPIFSTNLFSRNIANIELKNSTQTLKNFLIQQKIIRSKTLTFSLGLYHSDNISSIKKKNFSSSITGTLNAVESQSTINFNLNNPSIGNSFQLEYIDNIYETTPWPGWYNPTAILKNYSISDISYLRKESRYVSSEGRTTLYSILQQTINANWEFSLKIPGNPFYSMEATVNNTLNSADDWCYAGSGVYTEGADLELNTTVSINGTSPNQTVGTYAILLWKNGRSILY